MEKKKKRNRILIVTICVTAVILAGIGGVWTASSVAHSLKVSRNKVKIKNPEYVQAQMMDYLEERYHEKFVMKNYYPMGYSYSSYVRMEAWPEGKEDDAHEFEVQGYLNDEGNLDYFDTYVCVRLEKEFVKYFEPVMDEYFEDYCCDMAFIGEWIQHNVPADVTVEELLEYRANRDYPMPILSVCMNPAQEFELKKIELFCRDIQSKGFRGEIAIELPHDKEQYMEIVNMKQNGEVYHGIDGHIFFVYDDKIEGMRGNVLWD